MRTIRFRLSGHRDRAAALVARITGSRGVDRVEEVADQMHQRDDSSSLGLVDDGGGDFHDIELHVESAKAGADAHARIEAAARELGVAVEFVDDF
ncbi:MAG TPA: hypothetical protein VKB52_00690 [Rhodanobacteraceae bacterium]|nr:hypothetical protein [Rhodanobacteraceae bacterium]